MKNIKQLGTIFMIMAKIGLFTFGGGWSIVAQIQNEFVEKRQWITEEELVDYMSLAKSFPGIMIINMSIFCGYKLCGVIGAVVAAVGLSTPAIATIALVTYFYATVRDHELMVKLMNGVRSVVIPIILHAAWKIRKTALKGKLAYVIMGVSFILCTFTGISKLLLVVLALLIGLLIWKGRILDGDVS